MQVERKKLLTALQEVSRGLASKETVEQSKCFVFQDGKIYTYNEEIACVITSPIELEGAVNAGPLLEVLKRVPDEELTISQSEGELLIKGKSRRTGITLQSEIRLPINHLEEPTKWQKAPGEFLQSLLSTAECVSKDGDHFDISCVHVTPSWVESCDNYQISRYEIETGISEPCLIRGSSVKQLSELKITKIAISEAWFHFQTDVGLRISIRRYLGDYKDLSPFLTEDGNPLHLPAGIESAIEKAQIFSSLRDDGDVVIVSLKEGAILVEGRADVGWYQEKAKLNYSGPVVKFSISAKLLLQFTKRHSQCLLSENRMVVRDGNFVWAGCLGAV